VIVHQYNIILHKTASSLLTCGSHYKYYKP